MIRIRPFRALRPTPGLAKDVASVPYDVVNTEEASDMAAGNPKSFLHVVRPEIDLPAGTDLYDDRVYDKARENFLMFQDKGWLIREKKPEIYLYRQIMDGRSQVSIVASSSVNDYNDDRIKKHEKTRQEKEDDRTRHVLTLRANAGPVFLTIRDTDRINALIAQDTTGEPLFDFTADDDIQHTVWIVPDAQAYVEAFAEVPCSYVADGHHRSASAARAGAELGGKNPDHTGEEEYNWFLTAIFPANQLKILPYNRVVKDLAGKAASDVLAALEGVGKVALLRAGQEPTPTTPGTVCIHLDGKWYTLTFPADFIDGSDPVASLDVSLLQDRVLAPILGIGDPRTDNRIGFVGGIRGTNDLERRVNTGEAAIAFSLYPTTVEQLMAIADAGKIMPPKSTWFEPKLRSGLLVHTLDD
ncbi:MAG: DUF1015 domain-containing protein [Phycisphaerales bacterium]|nr:DUF1015 domain-containing protein [Phycisphaerales bacterium]